jgi:hypothetical protein
MVQKKIFFMSSRLFNGHDKFTGMVEKCLFRVHHRNVNHGRNADPKGKKEQDQKRQRDAEPDAEGGPIRKRFFH